MLQAETFQCLKSDSKNGVLIKQYSKDITKNIPL